MLMIQEAKIMIFLEEFNPNDDKKKLFKGLKNILVPEESNNGVFQMSSPEDSGLMRAKKKREMQENKKKIVKDEDEEDEENDDDLISGNINQCDLGMSPTVTFDNKGHLYDD